MSEYTKSKKYLQSLQTKKISSKWFKLKKLFVVGWDLPVWRGSPCSRLRSPVCRWCRGLTWLLSELPGNVSPESWTANGREACLSSDNKTCNLQHREELCIKTWHEMFSFMTKGGDISPVSPFLPDYIFTEEFGFNWAMDESICVATHQRRKPRNQHH